MNIQWVGHSCFKITHQGYSIVLDPYNAQMISGYSPLSLVANQVFCSHQHGDHNYIAAVSIQNSTIANPFTVERVESFHDKEAGAKRGKNIITILSAEGIRIAHLGDLGCVLTKEQETKLQNLDALMIPVGGFYTIDAQEAKTLIDRLAPRVVIPMHYQGVDFGPKAIAPLASFTSLLDPLFIIHKETNNIDINADTLKQVVVLRYSLTQ